MPSNSNAFVSSVTGAYPQNMPISGSVSIRAPLTLDDSEFEISSDATLSDSIISSVAEADLEPRYTAQEEDCFQLNEFSPLVQLRVAPFAQLSIYDEDEDEDNEIVGVARVPENFLVAPRIRVFDVEDENAETLVFSDDTGSNFSIQLENDIPFSGRVGEEMVADGHYCIGVSLAAYDDDGYSTASDSDAMSRYLQDSSDCAQFAKVRVVLNGLEKYGIEELYGLDRNEETRVEIEAVMQRKLEVETSGTTDMVEGSSNMGLLECNAEEGYNGSTTLEQNTSVNYLDDQNPQIYGIIGQTLISDVAIAENIGCDAITNITATQGTDGSHGVASHQKSGSEMLVSLTKSVDEAKDKSHDSFVGFESIYDACESNKIQGVECSELSDHALLQECTYLEKDMRETALVVIQDDELFCDQHSHENVEMPNLGDNIKEATTELNTVSQESKRDGSAFDEDVEGLMSIGLDQFREQISALSILLGLNSSGENSQEEQTVRSSHGNMNFPKDDVKSQLIHVDRRGESDYNSVRVTFGDESSVFFLRGSASFSSLPHLNAQAGFQDKNCEEQMEKIERIQTLSVEFMRAVLRVNASLEESFVSKVLCRLVTDIGMCSNQEFVIRSAKILAKKLEEDCRDELDFSLNILVLGKSGVGKSATINSIFGDMKVMTNAFEPATTSVKEVSGTINGVNIRILDTPGLRSHMKEQAFNRRILSSVKRYMQKFPPDVILYVDRVDIQTRDLNDLPILRSITNSLGPSVWQRAILTLTHAASTPLDGTSGSPLSYEVFAAQKSYFFQRSITKAVGDLCQLSPGFMCPVSLVDNHPLCGKAISDDCVLTNVFRWRSQLLALCFSLKTLSQVSSDLGPHTLFDHWKRFLFREDFLPLCHLCSCLLQSPAHLKFSANWNLI